MLRAFGGGNFQHDVAALFIQRSQALLQKQRTGTADEAGTGVLQQHREPDVALGLLKK